MPLPEFARQIITNAQKQVDQINPTVDTEAAIRVPGVSPDEQFAIRGAIRISMEQERSQRHDLVQEIRETFKVLGFEDE